MLVIVPSSTMSSWETAMTASASSDRCPAYVAAPSRR